MINNCLTSILISATLKVMAQGVQQDLSQPIIDKSRYKYLLAVAVLFLVFASGMVGYLIGVKAGENTKNQVESQPIHTAIMSTPPNTHPIRIPAMTISPMPTIDANLADWQTYTLKTIGLALKLPPEGSNTGQLTEHVITAANGGLLSGSIYTATITLPQYSVIIQANSTDSSARRSALFTDLIGYTVNNGQYSTKYHSSDGFRPVAIPNENIIGETTNPYGVHILKIKNTPDTITNFIFMNASVGALMNTSNPVYPGIVFQMDTSGNPDEKVFDQILATLRFVR